jgi:hypothetical protein
MNPILDAARAKLAARQAKIDALIERAASEDRALTDDEATECQEQIVKRDRQANTIEMLEAEEARKAAVAEALARTAEPLPQGEMVVRSEPMTYSQHSRDVSYLRDLAAIQVREAGLDHYGAVERMAKHARELEVEARTDPKVAERLAHAKAEMRTNPNTTAGTGGEFVPPLWLIGSYVPFFRPGRVCANRVRNLPLPPGIDVINIPLITTGSTTAIQTANAVAVSSTDIVTSSASANVNTIAGQEDISLQLLEQSPISMDNVVFDDLTADYDQRLDLQVISGTGSSGQHKGVQSVTQSATPGITTAFYSSSTSATFYGTAAGNVPAIIQGVNNIETIRYAAPTAVWVHPRRANWWLAGGGSSGAADTTHRPLFLTAANGLYNAVGSSADAGAVPQGVAGTIFGLPVVKDANMSTACLTGAPTGGTQDVAIVLKEDDQILWEGPLRMRALPEILSGTLQIRFQVYAYSAFMATRAPSSIAVAGGTGFAAPSF